MSKCIGGEAVYVIGALGSLVSNTHNQKKKGGESLLGQSWCSHPRRHLSDVAVLTSFTCPPKEEKGGQVGERSCAMHGEEMMTRRREEIRLSGRRKKIGCKKGR